MKVRTTSDPRSSVFQAGHTYRALTGELGLTPGQVRDWMRSYYQRMFLSQAQATPPAKDIPGEQHRRII